MTPQGRALVTGGAGLIGSHLVDLLFQEGYEVTILDSLEPQTHSQGKPEWVPKEARFIQGDVRQPADIEKALEGVQFIFHQAAFGGFTNEFSKYFDVNVSGTARLFERLGAGGHQVCKVVVASSQAVYAEGTYADQEGRICFPRVRSLEALAASCWELKDARIGADLKPVPTSEEKIKQAETPYALSKEMEERVALSSGKQLGIPVVALRYSVTYGPRQSLFNPYTGVVSIFSTRLLNGLPPIIYEDGRQTRDFIFVEDVARANLFVMRTPQADGQVFNVSTGRATTVAGLVGILGEILGRKIAPKISGEYRLGDVRHLILDPSRLKALGFETKTALEEGLRKFSAWISEQPEVCDYFSAAYEKLKQSRLVRRGNA